MDKSIQQHGRENLWNIVNKLRGREFSPEDLAAFLEKENAHFTADELIEFGPILTSRIRQNNQRFYLSGWLAQTFLLLAKGVSAQTICDPWAGLGFLVAMMQETFGAREALAITKYHNEQVLGKVLAPQINWQLGNPLQLLEKEEKGFDLVTSILPMGAKSNLPLVITLHSGDVVELTDDLGNLILVAASMRLSASGIGLYVVASSFFSNKKSVFYRFDELGLGIEAAFVLPSGTFTPYTNIPSYLIVVRRKKSMQLFVGQLSSDINTNAQIISNFKQGTQGGTLELGRFVDPTTFKSFEHLRASEAIRSAEERFGTHALYLADLGAVKHTIRMGRREQEFAFEHIENAIYIPLIGNSDVLLSPDELILKTQNYAQIVINSSCSNALFVARFLNSEFGKELRELTKSGAVIPRFNISNLRELRVFVPDLTTQKQILDIETLIATEQNTVASIQNEISELRRELWSNPDSALQVQDKIIVLKEKLSGGIKQHASESLEQWFETLPFPLASILRAWQATSSQDYKAKYEHLLHFFEGAAAFASVILLSAFHSNSEIFEPHKQKLAESMERQRLSFSRATFGTWKLVVEYLGKQTRELLHESKGNAALCAEIFSDSSLSLPEALGRKELAAIFSTTNKMRNDWSGHGGAIGQQEAQSRNQQLLAELQKLREIFADTWSEIQLIRASHCAPRRGMFENELAILMGSNGEFLKENRKMGNWMDVDAIYLSKKDSASALKLLPLIQVGPSPQSAKNACYFFNRLERDGVRFISYHFVDTPELLGQFEDATETIKFLTEI